MLTFRAGAPTNAFAAGEMARYYVPEREQSLAQAVAGYYGKSSQGMARSGAYEPMAERLGADTSRPITQDELANISLGMRTDGCRIEGKQYHKATENKGKITYYDFTFSAPKAASISWALAPTERERQIILDCHRYATDRAMEYFEQKIAWARRGRNGSKGADKGHMIWWKFEEYTARPVAQIPDGHNTILKPVGKSGDMQLHTHCITPNLVMTEQGHMGAIDTKRINARVKVIGKVYQAYFARKAREHGIDAGLDERTGMSTFHDVSHEAVVLFSKKTVDGNKAAKDYAEKIGENWEAMTAEQKARLIDRTIQVRRRAHPDDEKADFDGWAKQAGEIGYQHRSVLRPGQEKFLAHWRERLHGAFATSLPRLEEELDRRAVFGGEVAQLAAVEGLIEKGIGNDPDRDILAVTKAYRTEGVEQGIDATTGEKERTVLRWGKIPAKEGEPEFQQFTTEKHLRLERETIDLLKKGASDKRLALTPAEIDRAIAEVARETGIELTPHQRDMAHAIGTSGGVVVGRGVAGVGKTTILTPLVRAWHARGLDTVYLTVPWRQAHAGEESGVKRAQAIAAFTYGIKRGKLSINENTVVIADELSQIGTGMINDIANIRANHQFKLVGIGDDLQGNPIQAGNSLRMAEVVLGELPELLETVRQKKEEAEQVIKFRSGNEDVIREALEHKRSDGTLLVVPGDYNDAIKCAVDLWDERTQANRDDPKYRFGISVPTNADVLAAGAAIRARRQDRKEMGGDAKVVEAADQHGTRYKLPLAVGDRIRFFNRVYGTYGGAKRPGRVGDNGTVVEIISIQEPGLVVRNAKGHVAAVPWDQFKVPIKTGDRIRLTYGDAMTIDARQGDTVTEHLALYPNGSQAVNALKGYVAASRHRVRSWIVTSQGAELKEIKDRRPLGDARNQITARAKVEQFVIANMARNLARQEVKQLGVDFARMANGLRRGTIAAKEAVWDRPTKRLGRPRKVEERQAAPVVQAVVEAAKGQQEAVAEVVEQAQPQEALDVLARDFVSGEGALTYEDLVQFAYLRQVEQASASVEIDHHHIMHGVDGIDHAALHEKASDDVMAAIDRAEADLEKVAEHKPERDEGRER